MKFDDPVSIVVSLGRFGTASFGCVWVVGGLVITVQGIIGFSETPLKVILLGLAMISFTSVGVGILVVVWKLLPKLESHFGSNTDDSAPKE
ncbi:MAG: hypothetical protein ACKVJU_02970 [Verrucomicrobiales bacterium]